MLKSDLLFLVVGIGVLVGGMMVLQIFFESVLMGMDMVFVVVVYFVLEQVSYMDSVLQCMMGMLVYQVMFMVLIEKNYIYVIVLGL